jgi:hypothetical protein
MVGWYTLDIDEDDMTEEIRDAEYKIIADIDAGDACEECFKPLGHHDSSCIWHDNALEEEK